MITYFRPALILFLLLTLLTGVAYPLLVTGLAQLIFPEQANGSLLIDRHGHAVGSKLIGQSFNNPNYFWGRPSATSPYPYNAGASGGSNLGSTNPALIDVVKARIDALHTADPDNKEAIPVDLITASSSGLDPHISPAAVAYQSKRVASSRHIPEPDIKKLVDAYTEPRQWGLLGEPRINVLLLNHALEVTDKTGSNVDVE